MDILESHWLTPNKCCGALLGFLYALVIWKGKKLENLGNWGVSLIPLYLIPLSLKNIPKMALQDWNWKYEGDLIFLAVHQEQWHEPYPRINNKWKVYRTLTN